MIRRATICYRLPGRGETSRTLDVHAKTEKEAFDRAVEELKVDLLVSAAKTWAMDPTGLRLMVRSIVQLRPWAHDYEYDVSGVASDPMYSGGTITEHVEREELL